jgi:hypothetical protein
MVPSRSDTIMTAGPVTGDTSPPRRLYTPGAGMTKLPPAAAAAAATTAAAGGGGHEVSMRIEGFPGAVSLHRQTCVAGCRTHAAAAAHMWRLRNSPSCCYSCCYLACIVLYERLLAAVLVLTAVYGVQAGAVAACCPVTAMVLTLCWLVPVLPVRDHKLQEGWAAAAAAAAAVGLRRQAVGGLGGRYEPHQPPPGC